MELKNAVAVCLISLFSATLVVLIARALDSQAASRLEPQLARIVDELQALRASGGIVPADSFSQTRPGSNGLMVYYFHGNTRCPTCRAIESQSHETVKSDFAAELNSGQLTWKILNYEQVDGADLGKKFEVQMPVVVLARIREGQPGDWKRLDKVWALVNDGQAFSQYIREEIRAMLDSSPAENTVTRQSENTETVVDDDIDLPIPTGTDDLPE
jgi:hypothetical protein